ncbi:MAG TPA: acetyl-CoA carboxylase biotin carboxyl carrier protein [Candidatus Eisenbacteria bacterium]|jgi:acetyl-CoA carboxylase biotin carboxyl carrier protein|nr:acetyl-CoA carboxylase biotin carboxyl carrier protein [Candidatus Eisenbacteria bacterium]
MNIKEIKEMIQLMNENGLSEIEMEKEGLKIRLKKGASGVEHTIYQEVRPASSAARPAEPEPKETPKSAAAVAKTLIKSPMVGTFYSSPAPDAPPFLQPGSQVQVGQVICIIEAMKLMNEIKSEVSGKIAEILVNNGDPVEFGQALFRVE